MGIPMTAAHRLLRQFRGPAVALALILVLQSAPATPLRGCEKLAELVLPNGAIDSAQMISAGEFRSPEGATKNDRFTKLPAFCRVTATLTPSADSDIKTEIWLPATRWNGKLEALGNSGWAGVIPYSALAGALASGYAAAATDAGHTGNNADFALDHPEKLIDMAYRAVHEMTLEAKAVITAHYGRPATLAYFSGCSQGGRQGLAEAQKYPEDFDGIVAGAPSWNQMRAHAARVALNLLVNKPGGVIPPNQYRMIHNAVLQSCDTLDGVQDGVIEDPQQCAFDYSDLQCKRGESGGCLTAGQVASAKAMTSPLTDAKTGRVLFEGHLLPGAEFGWATLGGPQPLGLSTSAMRNVVFRNRRWDYHKMNVSSDVERAAQSANGALYSGDPDLSSFFGRGGKLLIYHGWNDQQVSPVLSIIYYESVLRAVGPEAEESIALFMIPGMNHCVGGEGTDAFNKVQVLDDWVARRNQPVQIIASHLTNGQVVKTRPLCPFPQTAEYSGSGSTDDAKNFFCASASEARTPDRPSSTDLRTSALN